MKRISPDVSGSSLGGFVLWRSGSPCIFSIRETMRLDLNIWRSRKWILRSVLKSAASCLSHFPFHRLVL